jgi:hypothetical protein
MAIERKYHLLLNEYIDLFTKVLGYYPISMHAHATDSLTIASMVTKVLLHIVIQVHMHRYEYGAFNTTATTMLQQSLT